MAQQNQATPTLQANIAGTTTTVNLRDWLNTRLSPFLKKAIIESFESEAEYPLQWLGEHLIQQSILFEGNPDITNIEERFRYKHEAKPPRTLVQDNTAAAAQQAIPTRPSPAPSSEVEHNVSQTVVVPQTQAQTQPGQAQSVEVGSTLATEQNAMETAPAESTADATSNPTPNVNGTGNGSDQVQDTEMSNAP